MLRNSLLSSILGWTTASRRPVQLLKTPGFYDNANLLDLLRLDASSLTEIQYLQTESSDEETHTNESMML